MLVLGSSLRTASTEPSLQPPISPEQLHGLLCDLPWGLVKENAYHCPAGMFSSLCVSKDLAIYNNSDLQYTVEGYEGKLSLCSILLISWIK